MIISDIILNNCKQRPDLNNTLIQTQKCFIKCDLCNKEYSLLYSNVIKGRNKYNKDLCRGCKQAEQYKSGSRSKDQCYKSGEVNRKKYKGKTLEYIVGEEKARQLRSSISNRTFGKNNPNYGGKYSHGFADRHPFRGKTLEEYHGKEKADKIKILYSNNSSGRNNPMYGKPSPQGSGNGWSGWYNNWYFRSLRELSYMINIIEKQNLQWENGEQNKYKMPYINWDGHERNYFADFVINNVIIEIKPKKLVESKLVQLKKEYAEKWCKKNGYAYIIIDDSQFNILSNKEIKELKEKNKIKFGDKYERLYQTRFGKI